jgi:hypothetical protein
VIHRKRLSCVLISALLALAAAGSARGSASPEQLAEQMLESIGGRSAWAKLTNTINGSQQNRVGEPTVVYAVITMDFTRPRIRIETTAPGLHLIRVIDGQRQWRMNREGAIEDIPAEVLLEDRRWYAGHVYRTLHRIAARDPALRLGIGRENRLEIYERAARIAWFALDARGEPYAFGAHDDDVGSISGPWDFIEEGIRHPAWVARPDGSWRAMIKELEINTPLTDAMFARPGESESRAR